VRREIETPEMIYVSCRNCHFVLETTASWRVETEIKHHVCETHPDIVQKMFDEEKRYHRAIAAIPKPTLQWSVYIMVESLPKKVGQKEYNIRKQ
jgi:hypothetical protein